MGRFKTWVIRFLLIFLVMEVEGDRTVSKNLPPVPEKLVADDALGPSHGDKLLRWAKPSKMERQVYVEPLHSKVCAIINNNVFHPFCVALQEFETSVESTIDYIGKVSR